MHTTRISLVPVLVLGFAALGSACDEAPTGLYPAQPARTTVKFDWFHRPLPDIPLPNDIATRPDRASATGLRINASIVAPTRFEQRTRELVDQLDGWGTLQSIAIPFTGPLDIGSILAGHRDTDYDTSNDVIYLINVDRASPELGKIHHLDLGEGNFPAVLESPDGYGPHDPRADNISLLFEEVDEDVNHNGVLDPGEDTDADGVLDVPNYLPGMHPARDDLAGRADALMSFYERETNTLIAWPLEPLRERTTYAVVVTRRLLDEGGEPVGSPFAWVAHIAQTDQLAALPEVIGNAGLGMDDVAFAFSYTTQSVQTPMVAVREGLYGFGAQRHLASEFPADITELFPLRDAGTFAGKPLHLLPGEQWVDAARTAIEFLGMDPDAYSTKLVLDGQRYVDYYVIGSYDSPQLFAREDAAGAPLGYNDQVWPPDLDRAPAKAVREKVHFTLAVPRKEVSVRGEGKPAPVVVLLHGHTGTRFLGMLWSAYMCKFGVAVLAIDGPTHGLNLDRITQLVITGAFSNYGLKATAEAVLQDRAVDMNDDGVPDPGADFWTAYLFHTRDMVRQFALDTMQLIRIFRGFDGTRRWNIKEGLQLDGLAGDFDGDGVVDAGGDAEIMVTGASLGGMLTMMLGGVEPEISAIVPIVGGGALSSVGVRSSNDGAKVGFMVRGMSPLYTGTTGTDGAMLIETYVPDLIAGAQVPLTKVTGVAPGDTLIVENVTLGTRGCGLVDPQGNVHAPVESNAGDRTELAFYRGAVLAPGTTCELAPGAAEVARVTTLDRTVTFQGKVIDPGAPITALAEGLGKRRGSPELRRLQGLGQLALDAGDPASFARSIQKEPLYFPGTGQRTGAHAMMLFTVGDTQVPNAAGMVEARAAGLLPYLTPDPRYGVPPNQVLIDNHIAEGIHTFKRFTDASGDGVHIDPENFSAGDDAWTASDLPRLDPPLRLGIDDTDALGGKSAAIFLMANPQGDHGFASPGVMTDEVRAACVAACANPPCDECATKTTFDVPLFIVNVLGEYLRSRGTALPLDRCYATNSCSSIPAYPAVRTDL